MNTVELLVQKGELEKVFERLLQTNSNRTLRNQALHLQSEWHENERSMRLGMLTHSDYTIMANRIRVALVDLCGRTNMSSSSSSAEDYSSKITVLQQLKKRVRFGFSQTLKSTLSRLLDDFLNYESTRRRNELFDIGEVEIEILNERYDAFIEAHDREIRTKHKVKVAALKRQLNELEQHLTVEAIQTVIDNLIALDLDFAAWKDAATSLNSSNMENFAYQLAEVIDGL